MSQDATTRSCFSATKLTQTSAESMLTQRSLDDDECEMRYFLQPQSMITALVDG